jgi:hypothetical protein
MSKDKLWIQNAVKSSSKGNLHKALGIPLDKKIPEGKIEKATNSKNPTIRKEANLANTLKGLRKGKKD